MDSEDSDQTRSIQCPPSSKQVVYLLRFDNLTCAFWIFPRGDLSSQVISGIEKDCIVNGKERGCVSG